MAARLILGALRRHFARLRAMDRMVHLAIYPSASRGVQAPIGAGLPVIAPLLVIREDPAKHDVITRRRVVCTVLHRFGKSWRGSALSAVTRRQRVRPSGLLLRARTDTRTTLRLRHTATGGSMSCCQDAFTA